MDQFDSFTQNSLEAQSATAFRVLIWIRARNRETGAVEEGGLWTGRDHREFVIGGQTRVYYGAGQVISVADMRAGVGLRVRYHRIVLPPFSEAVQQLLRVYDPRKAPIEVHQVALDPDTGRPLGPPRRMIKGTISKAPRKFGAKGQPSEVELEIASAARDLTRKPPLYRSQAALHQRNPNDRFREDVERAGERLVPWGRASSAGTTPTPPPEPPDLGSGWGP